MDYRRRRNVRNQLWDIDDDRKKRTFLNRGLPTMMEKTGVFEPRLPTMLENGCNQPWVTEDDGTRVVNRRIPSMMECV